MVLNTWRNFSAYKAALLNQPNQLKTLKLRQEILFVVHATYPFPILVTHDYLTARQEFEITPCEKCGLPELFDPIPQLIAHSFPEMKKMWDADQTLMEVFSSFCPVCGGMTMVKRKNSGIGEAAKPNPKTPASLVDQVRKWLRK